MADHPNKHIRFTITLEERVDDLDVVDAFYGEVNDASIAGGVGKTFIHFDREAESLDGALHQAISEVLTQGWRVREISVEPDCLVSMSTS